MAAEDVEVVQNQQRDHSNLCHKAFVGLDGEHRDDAHHQVGIVEENSGEMT